MHHPEMLSLNKGKNTIDLKGVSSGYEAIKLLLTRDKDFIPTGLNPKHKDTIFFGVKNVVEKEDAVIRNVDCDSSAECLVQMLHPKTSRITTDFYQPSRIPPHPRLLFEANAVNPNFLAFIYPREKDMPEPTIIDHTKKDLISYSIRWEKHTDHILINPNGKTMNVKGIETDTKLLFYRTDDDDNLIKLLVAEAKKLSIAGKEYKLTRKSLILDLK